MTCILPSTHLMLVPLSTTHMPNPPPAQTEPTCYTSDHQELPRSSKTSVQDSKPLLQNCSIKLAGSLRNCTRSSGQWSEIGLRRG